MGNVLNILITGGAGFIGSHLVEKFLSVGEKVIVVDNLLTGAIENLSSFNGNPNFIFMNHDVQHHIDIEMELDYVLHLASAASPRAYTEHPINTLKAGSSGTINTLGLAKAKNAKYLLTSTSEIYGNPKVSPQSETYWGNVNPNGPRSMYDEAKRFSEAAVSSYNRIYNLNTRIVRLFNTFGPKQNEFMIIPYILSNLKQSRSIEIKNFYSSRDFTYISDIVNGIFLAGLNGRDKEIYNLGSGNETSIENLIQTIKYILNIDFKVAIKDVNYAGYNTVKRSQADITKAKKELLWKPIKTLEDGLLLTSKILGLPEELT